MLMVVATPFTGILELFVVVPLGILAGIYGTECATALRHRPRRTKRP